MTTVPSTTMVGVARLWWSSTSSRKDSGSWVTSFNSNSTPRDERNSLAVVQAGQPGWV